MNLNALVVDLLNQTVFIIQKIKKLQYILYLVFA